MPLLITKIAAVTFANADGTERQVLMGGVVNEQELRIVPEPENPVDPAHAMRVETVDGAQLGYIPQTVPGFVGHAALLRPHGQCTAIILSVGPDIVNGVIGARIAVFYG